MRMTKNYGDIKLSEFPDNTYIYLDDEIREELFRELEKKFCYLTNAGKKLNVVPRNLYEWRSGIIVKLGKSIKRYTPLIILKKICYSIGIKVDDLQNRIIEIKTNSRSEIIKNPKLPLPIVPEMFAILGHLISDGYGGEKGHSCYVNTSKEALYNFIDKLKKSFGDIYYHVNLKHDRVIIPKLVPKILKKYFEIDDFRSSKSIISEKLYNASRECLVEFVKSIIIDEGRVGDNGIEVVFTVNQKLTEDVKKICEKRLGYQCNQYKNSFMISSNSFPKLFNDMRNLVIPKKQTRFIHWFNSKSRKWYNSYRGTTKKKIINNLLNKPMSVEELAYKIGVQLKSINSQINGYNFKGKRMPGLLDLGLIKFKNREARESTVYKIKDKDKALAYIESG